LPERYRPCFLLGRSPGPEAVEAGMNIVVRRGTPVAEADRMAEEVRGRLHSGAASS
jgi:hypothetical protein